MKVLGIIPRDSGRIPFEGKEVRFNNHDAKEADSHHPPELSVMPSLSVIENLFMGHAGRLVDLLACLERRAHGA